MTEVLNRFGATCESARKNLATFLGDGLKQGTWEDFYKADRGRFLGSDEFIERAKAVIDEPVRQARRSLMKLSGVIELLEKASACFKLRPEELMQAGKERRISCIRQAVVEVGRGQYRFSVLELAKHLKRSEPAISQITRRRWESREELAETRQLRAFLVASSTKVGEGMTEEVKC